jgi:hypothetical protein
MMTFNSFNNATRQVIIFPILQMRKPRCREDTFNNVAKGTQFSEIEAGLSHELLPCPRLKLS